MDSFDKLYNKSLRFLSFRPRSEKEIRDYLKLKIKNPWPRQAKRGGQISKIKNYEEIIGDVINKLKEQKFLDDEEFTKWWIEQRTVIKPRAWKIIKLELKRKGISDETIENTVQNSPASTSEAGRAEFRIQNDLETALQLARKRIDRLKKETPQKKYEKMFRFLSSKGFDYDTIKEVIDQVLSKEYN